MKKRLSFSVSLLVSILMLTANSAFAQYEEDTKTVTSTIEALYEVISGPKGQERDWDRFNNLFYEGANLIPVGVTPDSVFVNILTYDQYEEVAGQWLVDNGFFEIELSRTEERYGHIVHAFSTYGSYHTAEDVEKENPYDRGINSIQLLTDGNRWYVLNVFWDSESRGSPIPEKYLKSK